jgi:hypothetical protein
LNTSLKYWDTLSKANESLSKSDERRTGQSDESLQQEAISTQYPTAWSMQAYLFLNGSKYRSKGMKIMGQVEKILPYLLTGELTKSKYSPTLPLTT